MGRVPRERCGCDGVCDCDPEKCDDVRFPGREGDLVCILAGRDQSIWVGILWAWRMRKQASRAGGADVKVEHQGRCGGVIKKRALSMYEDGADRGVV